MFIVYSANDAVRMAVSNLGCPQSAIISPLIGILGGMMKSNKIPGCLPATLGFSHTIRPLVDHYTSFFALNALSCLHVIKKFFYHDGTRSIYKTPVCIHPLFHGETRHEYHLPDRHQITYLTK